MHPHLAALKQTGARTQRTGNVAGRQATGLDVARITHAAQQALGSRRGFSLLETSHLGQLVAALEQGMEVPHVVLQRHRRLIREVFDKVAAADLVLRQAQFYIVAVPTPIDEHAQPDLKPLLGASGSVGKVLKKGDYVVFESTVYPGCTEEDCIPVMERLSGLKFPTDFKVGYSPERINPGDKEHTLERITKVVSGEDADTLERVASTYGAIIDAGVHRAPSVKVAEAAAKAGALLGGVHADFSSLWFMAAPRVAISVAASRHACAPAEAEW